jgi:hypothetical protein
MAKAKGAKAEKPDEELEHAWSILTDEAVLRSRAAKLLQTFLASDAAQGSDWQWEVYVSDLFDLPLDHPAVERLAAKIRVQERPYGRINYATPTKAQAFVGRLEQHAYPAFQGPS